MGDQPRYVLCRELRERAELHGETASILHQAALAAESGHCAGALRFQSCHHRIRSMECNARADALGQDGYEAHPSLLSLLLGESLVERGALRAEVTTRRKYQQ